jgi:hypothetical protein
MIRTATRLVTSTALVAGFACAGAAWAQRAPVPPQAAASAAPTSSLPDRFAGRAGRHYKLVWGVDALSVKLVESGQIIRFSWRVLDPQKASTLNDKSLEPALVAPQAGVSLVVPQFENIGQMRQSSTPEAGKSYWMAFSSSAETEST